MSNTQESITLYSNAARLLAEEVLLAEPELLADVLESCLYILRDVLEGKGNEASNPSGLPVG